MTSNRNLYPRRSEVDLRQEMENTLSGTFPEISKTQTVVLRKMRRDTDYNLVKCPCYDELTREPDKDSFCQLCFGEGNLWDEIYLDVYRSSSLESSSSQALAEKLYATGLHNIPIVTFYTRYSEDITEDDKVIELVLDKDGVIINPPKRRRVFRIVRAVDYRLENGRVEYYALNCFQEQVRFLNGVNG
jgi:hypothetical protein